MRRLSNGFECDSQRGRQRTCLLVLGLGAMWGLGCAKPSSDETAKATTKPGARRPTARPAVRTAAAPTSPRRSKVRRPPAARLKNRAPQRFRIRFFSAGHGDAILLRTPAGHAVLVDAGRGNAQFLGDNLVRRRLVPFCRAHGVRRLDAFIVTHPHWDHFGDPVTLHSELGVNRIHVNADGKHVLGQALPAFVPGMSLTLLHAGKVLRFGKLRLQVLHPAKDAKPAVVERDLYQQNNRSLVIRATYGRHRFLLTGDLMRRGELRLLARGGPGQADVLKLGHHGIKQMNASWLQAVRPRFAVASLGAKWRKGFDSLPKRVGRFLSRRGIRLLRTDRDGDVVFVSDGETLTVETHPKLTLMPEWAPKWRKNAVRSRSTASTVR